MGDGRTEADSVDNGRTEADSVDNGRLETEADSGGQFDYFIDNSFITEFENSRLSIKSEYRQELGRYDAYPERISDASIHVNGVGLVHLSIGQINREDFVTVLTMPAGVVSNFYGSTLL